MDLLGLALRTRGVVRLDGPSCTRTLGSHLSSDAGSSLSLSAGSTLSLSAGSHLSLSSGSSPGTANDFAAFQASEIPRCPPSSLPGGMCGAMENCTGSTAQIVLGTVNDFAASQAREIPRVIVPIPPPSAPTPSERNGTNNWPHVPRAQTHTDSGLYDRVWSGSIPKSRESWSRIYNAGPPD